MEAIPSEDPDPGKCPIYSFYGDKHHLISWYRRYISFSKPLLIDFPGELQGNETMETETVNTDSQDESNAITTGTLMFVQHDY